MSRFVLPFSSLRILHAFAVMVVCAGFAPAATITNVSGFPKWNPTTGQIEIQTTFTLGDGETFLYMTMEIVDAENGERVVWQRDNAVRDSRDPFSWNFKDPNKIKSGRKYTVYITMYYKAADGTIKSVTASGTVAVP
ncbi:MAG: hypothetical protein K1X57_18185 [Gemmataceae bacterium]|nr:hypothetical protein [Gemmataceae bacterium]